MESKVEQQKFRTAVDDVAEKWNGFLWDELTRQALHVGGASVVTLLRQTSEEMWNAGLDHAFVTMTGMGVPVGKATGFEERALQFDSAWLVLLLTKIARERLALEAANG